MTGPICDRHNIELRIRWYKEGTPRQDFDGYYCPECEAEQKAAEKKYREENAYWLDIVLDAKVLEKTIDLRRPYQGFEARYGWEATEKYYASAMKSLIAKV